MEDEEQIMKKNKKKAKKKRENDTNSSSDEYEYEEPENDNEKPINTQAYLIGEIITLEKSIPHNDPETGKFGAGSGNFHPVTNDELIKILRDGEVNKQYTKLLDKMMRVCTGAIGKTDLKLILSGKKRYLYRGDNLKILDVNTQVNYLFIYLFIVYN